MINLNEVNDKQIFQTSEDERLTNNARSLASIAIQKWINKVTNIDFTYPNDFRKSVTDGVLLCKLLNSLKPGSIKRINKLSTTASGSENIENFLRSCEEDFGLSHLMLFKSSDLEDLSNTLSDCHLEEEKRIDRVLLCLFHLAKSVEDHLTTAALDSTPFNILLKVRDVREIKKIRSYSNTDDSIFESSTTDDLFLKQTQNYSTYKVQNSLLQAKVNQELLTKSLDNDDWQESLENWKEKRRQAVSQSVMDSVSPDLDVDSNDKELMKLKEKARQMKQLRDQIKDQHIQPPDNSATKQKTGIILDIDDETKAMIERVKQKKFFEEKKRQINASSPTITSFTSDSEFSNSIDNNDSIRSSEKNNYNFRKPLNVRSSGNNKTVSSSNYFSKGHRNTHTRTQESRRSRIIQVKLVQRSKLDNDHLWGMELVDRCGMILVSKVKIGSSADICEIRKNDEILSINSRDVSNHTLNYVKSLFNKYSSLTSPSDYITLSIRRIATEEDDESFSENISEIIDIKSNKKPELNHRSEIQLTEFLNKSNGTNLHQCDSFEKPLINNGSTHLVILENREGKSGVDKDLLLSEINEHSEITSDSLKPLEMVKIENEETCRPSVHDKIAKFECPSVSKNSILESSFSGSKYQTKTNSDWLSVNSKINDSKQTVINHSKTNDRNTTEAINSKPLSTLYCGEQSINNDSINPIGIDFSQVILESCEQQQMDICNINISREEKGLFCDKGENSSTSDDISPIKEISPVLDIGDNLINTFSDVTDGHNKQSTLSNDKVQQSSRDFRKISAPQFIPTRYSSMSNSVNHPSKPIDQMSKPVINRSISHQVSTGIQTNPMIQSRNLANYTTVTTSFDRNSHKNIEDNSISSKPAYDDKSLTISMAGVPCKNTENEYSRTEFIGQDQHSLKEPQLGHLNLDCRNDISKDFTTITSVMKEKEKDKKLDAYTTLITDSNLSPVRDEGKKFVEIEVSITPALFPIRNKTLLSKSIDEDAVNDKNKDLTILEKFSLDNDNSLVSEYLKMTNFEDLDFFAQDNFPGAYVKSVISSEKEREEDFDSYEPPENVHSNELLKANYEEIEPTISKEFNRTKTEIPPKPDISKSVGISYSKSDTINSVKGDPVISYKKTKKINRKSYDSLDYNRSSSTKDFPKVEGDKRNVEKSNTIYLENPSRSISHNRLYSPSQVTFSQDIIQTKSRTKTFSIEKSLKFPSRSSSQEKKKEKSKNKKSNSPEINTKCSSCNQPAGSEDLMVIEELNLHFHLRCFVCCECKMKLGDGKSDADVRIRRSKLHCATCYSNKKSSKTKSRNPTGNHQQQHSVFNNIQHKGGIGDGEKDHKTC